MKKLQNKFLNFRLIKESQKNFKFSSDEERTMNTKITNIRSAKELQKKRKIFV